MDKELTKGIWLGQVPQAETEALKAIEDAAYNRTVERMNIALEVMNWVVSHQAVGERVVSLNPLQQRRFQRHDSVGGVYLPDYVKAWNR